MNKRHAGLPSRQQILDFITQSDVPAGKREIARAFGLKGQERIALKALLRDMADEGLISKTEAVTRVQPWDVDFYLHPQFDINS